MGIPLDAVSQKSANSSNSTDGNGRQRRLSVITPQDKADPHVPRGPEQVPPDLPCGELNSPNNSTYCAYKDGAFLDEAAEIEKVATFSLTQSQKIWENVSHSCLSNVQKDIAWNTVHSSLPTRAFMFRRGLAQVETCPYAKCRKREEKHQSFWECDVAGSVWLSVSVFLNRFADTAKMTAETVLYGPAGGIDTSTAKCVWRVINVVKQILWEGRNICVYHKQ
ncbi:UNVERIFIED_CONTAM: hypothetical protein FKN15_076680 [Acipenser sinensis]